MTIERPIVLGTLPLLQYNRWLHICSAIDFQTSKLHVVVNGAVPDPTPSNSALYNISQHLGTVDSMREKFVIGAVAKWGKWFGK